MLAPHSVTTVDTEHCGCCEAMGVEIEERGRVCVCLSECVMVGWIPSVCCVHTEREIYSSALKGYGLVSLYIHSHCSYAVVDVPLLKNVHFGGTVTMEMPLGDHKSCDWSAWDVSNAGRNVEKLSIQPNKAVSAASPLLTAITALYHSE